MRKVSLGLLVAVLLLGSLALTPPAHAEDKRIIGTPDYVVFLKDDGSLEYYEVINSVGFFIGFTPPGWRNDRLGQQLIHVATRADGARAELWHKEADIYYVDMYRADGSLIGSGTFSAAGIPGGQFGFAPQTPPSSTTTVTTTTTTTATVYTVVRGDTLYRIARRFGVSISAIMAANGITNANLIYAGQRLIIPY